MKKLFALLLVSLLLISSCAVSLAEVFPLENTVEFNIVVKKGANDIGEDYGAKQCVIDTEKATNVKINWTAYSGSAYNEKVPMLIGEGGIDAFCGGGVNVLANYEAFVDISQYLEEYMPTWNAYLNENPLLKSALTMTDGGIYNLPIADTDFGTYYADGLLYVHDDFLNNCLGGKLPSSIDELYDALVLAKNTDFNGNGLGDEIPLLACDDYKHGLDKLFGYWGIAIGGGYVMYSDYEGTNIEFVANTPAYKEALQTISKWYSEDLINADVYSMGNSDFTSRFQESDNVAFCITHTPDFNFADGLTSWTLITNMTNGDYKPLFLANGSYGTMEGFVITTECENPELLCAWFDYIHTDFETWAAWSYGEKGKIWDYAEDGVHYVSYLMGEAKESGLSYGKWRQTYSAHTGGPKYGGMYQPLMTYAPAELVKGGSRNYFVNQMQEQISLDNTRLSVVREGYWDYDLSTELDDLDTAIDTYCDSFKANTIVNGFSEEAWNKYCEELEKSSLDVARYIELYNEYLHRNDK